MVLAPLDNSVVFKKLFRDPEILSAFIKDLLDIDVQFEADQIETEKKFTPPIGNVDIAYDIFVDDPERRLIIEIQRVYYSAEHYDRFLHYLLVAIIEFTKSYKKYRLDRAVHTIVWLTRRVQDKNLQKSVMTTSFQTLDEMGNNIDLYPHKLHFLNPHYINDKTPAGVVDWFNLIVESIENPDQPKINLERSIIERATQLIAEDGLSPGDRANIIDENEFQDSLQEGIQQGIEQGLKQGMEKGIEQGMEKGIEQGMEKGIEQMARGLLEEGMTLSFISKITKLSEEEILSLGS